MALSKCILKYETIPVVPTSKHSLPIILSNSHQYSFAVQMYRILIKLYTIEDDVWVTHWQMEGFARAAIRS